MEKTEQNHCSKTVSDSQKKLIQEMRQLSEKLLHVPSSYGIDESAPDMLEFAALKLEKSPIEGFEVIDEGFFDDEEPETPEKAALDLGRKLEAIANRFAGGLIASAGDRIKEEDIADLQSAATHLVLLAPLLAHPSKMLEIQIEKALTNRIDHMVNGDKAVEPLEAALWLIQRRLASQNGGALIGGLGALLAAGALVK